MINWREYPDLVESIPTIFVFFQIHDFDLNDSNCTSFMAYYSLSLRRFTLNTSP
jgi:hypothetical protein